MMNINSGLPKSLRIGVLRGGPSSEYEISLKTGAHVLKHLSETHVPLDIFISKDGKWHVNGIERSPDRILKHVDVVWNGLHGEFGEDGKVQEILDLLGVPYTGSKKFESAIAMNKWMTKERVRALGVKTPVGVVVRRSDSLSEKAQEIFDSLPHPLVVKPVSGGSSHRFYKVESYQELLTALEETLTEYDSAIVEDYIVGKSASVGIIENFRDQNLYALPVVEISNTDIVPGNFSDVEKKEMEQIARLVHQSLGLRHFSNSDFVVSPKRGVYFLETNTSPKLTSKSHSPEVLDSMGVSIKDFLHHILKLAIFETGIWL